MSKNKVIARVVAVLFGAMLIAAGTFGVFADPDDSQVIEEETVMTEAPQPETEEPQPETQAPQPETEEPQPETQAPQPETEAPQPETEAPQPETEQQETQAVINNNDDYNNQATEFYIPPTVPKTVSKKTYSTNYAFGIASWICAGVGVVVILAVAISTKAGSGRNGV